MENEGKKVTKGQRSRYIWDPNKLAWVETVEETPKEEPVKEAELPRQREPVRQQEPQKQREPARQPEPVRRYEPAREERVAAPVREVVTEETPTESDSIEALVEAAPEYEVTLEYRGAWLRLLAVIVDFVIISIVTLIIGQIRAYPIWGLPIMGFVYFVGFWAWRGQTPGKMLIGAKIVKLDGSKISFVNAVLRYLLYFIPSFGPIFFFAGRVGLLNVALPILSLIVIGFTGKKRGIHDMIAGTCVINTRFRVPQSEVYDEPEMNESSDTDTDTEEADIPKQG